MIKFRGKTLKRPGISPAKASAANQGPMLAQGAAGTDENPVMMDGYPYVYSSAGKLVRRLDFDPDTMEIFVLKRGCRLTEEQEAMLKSAAQMPVVYDEECPKSTPDRLERFRRYGMKRNERRREAQSLPR